jgi:hypothetical protein
MLTEIELRKIIEDVLRESINPDLDIGDNEAIEIRAIDDGVITIELFVPDKDDEDEEATVVESQFRVKITVEKI